MYDIFLENKKVGTAFVEKEGLYYCFNCKCSLPPNNIFKINISDGNNITKLGICIPNDDKFILNKRVPIKYLSGDSYIFSVESVYKDTILLVNSACFDYLDKLETARLKIINKQAFIVIC